jgi:preprotein translocase subunit SecE
VARDRQRAKQRKQRRLPQPSKRDDVARDESAPDEVVPDEHERLDAAGQGERGEDEGFVPEPRPIHRENAPAAFEHGGEVDQFEASLVAGAEGQPETDPDAVDRSALGGDADAADAFGDRGDDGSGLPGTEPAGAGGGAGGGGGAVVAPDAGEAPAAGRGGSRFANFLRASWAELQRVQWPNRRQVGQATAVVMGFVIVAGAFLGLADFLATEIVDLII